MQQMQSQVISHQFELVWGIGRQTRHEQFPQSGRCMSPHHVYAAVPASGRQQHRDSPNTRGPQQEMHALAVINRTRLRTQQLPGLVESSFAKQLYFSRVETTAKAIGVLQHDVCVTAVHAQTIGLQPLAWHQSGKQPFGMQALECTEQLFAAGVQHFDGGGTRQEDIDLQLPAFGLVHAHQVGKFAATPLDDLVN